MTTPNTHAGTPVVPDELLRDTAAKVGVCVRPIIRRVTDTTTGESDTVPLPCGSTRASVCPSCAEKNRRLRMQQCREGWHRTDDPADLADDSEPDPTPDPTPEDGEDPAPVRRRSTRRVDGFEPLPVVDMEYRTIGRELTSPTGKTYRPSMWLTVTLPSYGKVHHDPARPKLLGTPVDPDNYDYRRAALDAIHFPKLVDRFWQNLRRCAGFKVQYFGCVEPQKRLALHMHAAVRGVVGRPVFNQVVKATYEQVWWPAHETPVYVDRLPVSDERTECYVDPDDGVPLMSWEQAMDRTYEPGAEPAHLLRFGGQMDSQWFIPGSTRTDRRIGYICKYVTKAIAETYNADVMSPAQRQHLRRLHAELRWLPCCPECPNWLRYGIQPKNPEPGLEPGYCNRPAHRHENLGHGGRRVLVSRDWSGKTLTEHKADRADVVRAALAEAGLDTPDNRRWSTDQTDDTGTPRYAWEPVDITAGTDTETYRIILRRSIAEALQWRRDYEAAKEQAAARPPNDTRSATSPSPHSAGPNRSRRSTR